MQAARAVAAVFLCIIVVATLVRQWGARASYDTPFRDSPNCRISMRFPLGTDDLGRDVGAHTSAVD